MSKRSYRRRNISDSDGEEDKDEVEVDPEERQAKKLKETKEIQKFRKRPVGVSAAKLALGQKISSEDEKLAVDPFKLKTGGGLVSLQDLASASAGGSLDEEEDEVMKRLSSTFSAETNRRDEDDRMLKYIEEEMRKRKKSVDENEKRLSAYEAKIKSLYQVPDRLKVEGTKSTEEMLSNQMLSGIPEVNLGLDAKFQNIEETLQAKEKLIKEHSTRKKENTSFAVTNYAANYTHHSLRFFKDREGAPPPKEQPKPEVPTYIPVVGEAEPEMKYVGPKESTKKKTSQTSNATDDFHFEKYRKKMRM
jgi:hypothetical protein